MDWQWPKSTQPSHLLRPHLKAPSAMEPLWSLAQAPLEEPWARTAVHRRRLARSAHQSRPLDELVQSSDQKAARNIQLLNAG